LAAIIKEENYNFETIINLDGLDTAGKGRTIREVTEQLDVSFFNKVAFT